MRTIVDLPEQAVKALAKICAERHISRAEAVRQAVSSYIEREAAEDAPDLFGVWRDRSPADGLQYEDEVRREWDLK